MYGRDIEPWKKAFHYVVFYGDVSLYRSLGVDIPSYIIDISDVDARASSLVRYLRSLYDDECKYRCESYARLFSLKGLQSLQRLQGLQSLQRFGGFSLDYQDVPIPDDAVVYCDIPYKGTNVYDKSQCFDYERFYSWALSRPFPVFVSEYSKPEGFSVIDSVARVDIMCATDNAVRRIEKVFVQDRFAHLYRRTLFDMDNV